MNTFRNPQLKAFSQALRKNMTKEERRLWYAFLKTLPIPVHRQKAIGNYIVDFYCARAKVVIELDGSQHFESNGKLHDTARDVFLQNQGITVLRYSNLDVNRCFRRVCEDIYRHLSPFF